jgi:acetamidase/formamidase
MATYTIEPERKTLHGTFSRDYPPVLTIDSGDTVCFRTLATGWWLEPPTAPNVGKRFEPRDPEHDQGHALCGPVAIRGAEPGMTLEVEIKNVQPAAWGWTTAGSWRSELNKQLGVSEETHLMNWKLDTRNMIGENQFGHKIALSPFMGVMGMPPGEPGIHSTIPPRTCGGNIDCKELVAGTKLFLPIAVPGGLFSTGDGHAVQGDGEVSITAIECPMERAELTFGLREDMKLKTPYAWTPHAWLTLGFDRDLDEAMTIALDAMLDLIGERYKLERTDALALASLAVDLRITQVVNDVRGVHAVLPHNAIK